MLELGARVPVLLAHCAGSALSDAQVASLAAAAVGAVATGARAEGALGAAAAADVALREGLAGVATLVAEAARLSLTAAELKGPCAQSFYVFPQPWSPLQRAVRLTRPRCSRAA
jgi:hypothetical protein